jgi:hypothetical protein
MKAYILTTEYNHYDQMGEYFIAWFHKKPSPDELRQVMIDKEEEDSCELCCHILDGGGRTKRMEDQWYYLREVSSANAEIGQSDKQPTK